MKTDFAVLSALLLIGVSLAASGAPTNQAVPLHVYAGDGHRGNIQKAPGLNKESGIVQAATYILPPDATLRPADGERAIYIFATNSIELRGTVDLRGRGGPAGVDGAGLAGRPGNENGGGGSGIPTQDVQLSFMQGLTPLPTLYGAGGGSAECLPGQLSHGAGGGGNVFMEGTRGAAATTPAGQGTPGQGGAGGGLLVLVAPSVTITGTIDARGADGTPGTNGCGGGGGGAGGVILVRTDTLIDTSTTLTSGGQGGGNGGAGAAGHVIKRGSSA